MFRLWRSWRGYPNSVIGSIVHYVRNSSGGDEFPQVRRAAVVTEAGEEALGLISFEPTGQRFYPLVTGGIRHGIGGGTWHHLDECRGSS
jgi:hypothetical protein